MPWQTQNLVMVALGSLDDKPPNNMQQTLLDGIHLRWAFKPERGFPWYGYYLFRRISEAGETVENSVISLQDDLDQFSTGPYHTNIKKTIFGELSSDKKLVFTEDFQPDNYREVDLFNREYLRCSLPVSISDLDFAIEVEIGYRSNPGLLTTLNFTNLLQRTLPNPFNSEGLSLKVYDPSGQKSDSARIGRTLITPPGLLIRRSIEIDFDQPRSKIRLSLSRQLRSAPPKIQAFNSEGRVVATRIKSSNQRRNQKFYITGTDISKLTITAAQGEVYLHEIFSEKETEIEVTALSGLTPVAQKKIVGFAGDIKNVTFDSLSGENVTSLSFSSGAAALIDIRYIPISRDALEGWEAIPEFPYPMCLPVAHPDYQCPNKPITAREAEFFASNRLEPDISGGNSEAEIWLGSYFGELHEQLTKLVEGGPPPAGEEMADRQSTMPVRGSAKWISQYPLDLVLLGSLNPLMAKVVGLYFTDCNAQREIAYDYLIVADHEGVLGGTADSALNWLASLNSIDPEEDPNNDHIDAYIVQNKKKQQAPPLTVPGEVRSYALPGGMVQTPSGELVDKTNNVGLTWDLGLSPQTELLPSQPIAYHMWRAYLNADEPAAPPSAAGYRPITENNPIFVQQQNLPSAGKQPPPSDWPSFPLNAFDLGLADGWYCYQVSGIDIFGRHSANSEPASWYQWHPVYPEPWYYVLKDGEPGNWEVHPFAIQLQDRIPPPSPVGVEVYALDPEDPLLVKDQPYDDWYESWLELLEENPTDVVGLRVRWRWTQTQMTQAPDTREFRIYFNPGTEPPTPDHSNPFYWQERFYVVGYDQHVVETTDNDEQPIRQYEIFLPIQGDAFQEWLPLTPSLAEPIVYGHIGISAADDKTYVEDVPKWESGHWGNRYGNEGSIGLAVKVFRVWRQPPLPPDVPPADSESVFATPANYNSESFFTYRWVPSDHLKTHIFRALDDSIFKVDWEQRPRPDLTTAEIPFSAPQDPRWDEEKQQQVVDELNALNGFSKPDDKKEALSYYRGLSNDSLRVLAGLPGNEKAFTQITIQPLDPDDGNNANRLAPENQPDFVVDPNLRAYTDTLDGRTSNRYFYRACHVDGAHNRGSLSLSSPPIYLPNVVPPRAPVITKISLGDSEATLFWASNRETDLADYKIFRCSEQENARDIRLMGLPIHIISETQSKPEHRPQTLSWTDTNLVAGTEYWYCIQAVDIANNSSRPSEVKKVIAVDRRTPVVQTMQASWRLRDSGTSEINPFPSDGVIPVGQIAVIQIQGQASLPGFKCTISRRAGKEMHWTTVANFDSETETIDFVDIDVKPKERASYRLRLIGRGSLASEFYKIEVEPLA
jgi:hypothetical protein